MSVTPRKIGPFSVYPIGLGCMNVSHAYGAPPSREDGARLLNAALDLGYDFLDTAALYGLGKNEELLGEAVMARRSEFTLASKCGLVITPDGRKIDSSPEASRQVCEDSLRRLKTDVIDLYYLHRWDKTTPVEEAAGGLGRLVEEGKVRAIGLSECSADTLRKAHGEFPVTAVQSEYSLWTRNPEIAVLDACRELGVAFVPFSPVGRGFLTDEPPNPEEFHEKDIRRPMPRFSPDNWPKNLALLDALRAEAQSAEATPAQVALAWLLAKGEDLVPIPGTTSLEHLEENFHAAEIALPDDAVARLDAAINQDTVSGPRYPAKVQPEIDTEEFAAA